jgi:hypothetical protein
MWSPNETTVSSVQLGLDVLSYGSISFILLVGAVATSILLIYFIERANKGKKD